MGHVQSKRKRERKRRKITQLSEIMKTISMETDNIHQVADHRIYRDSSTTDQLSNSSGYFSSNEPSPNTPGKEEVGWSLGSEDTYERSDIHTNDLGMSPIEELYTYKGLPIEDHPALTSLQNEQNARLENMEQRMSRIRTSAQQAYDRKKFAHIFRAKREDSRTEKLLKEARDLLQHNIDLRSSGQEVGNSNVYSGEIIPVHYVEDEKLDEQDDESYLHLTTFGSLKFSMFIVFDFFLLLLLFLLLLH